MDKTKIIPIILLVVILGIGFVAFTFYTEKEDLTITNQKISQEKADLLEANNNLKYKYDKVEKERVDSERKLFKVKGELSKVEAEMETWKKKWSSVSKERDELVEKMKSAPISEMAAGPKGGELSEDHWADFVQSRASLEVKFDTLSKALFEEKTKMAKLENENKELTSKIDQLTKEKDRLLEEIKFKERTLRIVSMDLVSEREERGAAVNEVKKLRKDNVDLKRELIVANKDLMRLQDTLKEVVLKKDQLEDKIADADNILKEKSMAFEELQEELEQVIVGGKKVVSDEAASVELPPIIVKPSAPGLQELRGEVIAVNHEEKFVVIDIGESSGLRPGALLKVMRGDKVVGSVEVIETRKEISAADIKEVVGGYTVQEGDIAITR